LSMLPDSIGLGPREAMPKIQLEDSFGIRVIDTALSMQAGAAVAFQGKRINAFAPSQVSMFRAGNGLMSTFNVSKDFNVCGADGSMEGTSRAAIHIPERRAVEELGNPEEIEKAAIASMPIGGIGERDVFEESEDKGLSAHIPVLLESQLQAAALSAIPIKLPHAGRG